MKKKPTKDRWKGEFQGMYKSNGLKYGTFIDIQIEEGLRRNYNITTLEEHLKMERVDKDKLLDRLIELSDEIFTFNAPLRYPRGRVGSQGGCFATIIVAITRDSS